MKIRTKLEISTLIVFVGALVIGAVLFLTAQQINKATEDNKISIEILQKITQLSPAEFNNFANSTELMEWQWSSKNTALTQILRAQFRNPQGRIVIENIRQNQQDMQAFFHQLIQLKKGLVSEVSEQNLQDKILLKWQSLLDEAFSLNRISQSEIEATERSTNSFIFIFIGILGVFVVTTSFLVRKSVIEPIARLYDGVKIIGDGNLKYRNNLNTQDEIGELAQAFNTMATKLSGFYENLEEKVRIRSEEIIEKNALFQSLIDNVPIGVALVKAPQGELLMINQTGAQLLGGTLGCEVNSSHYLAQCNFLKEDETPYPFEELPISLTFKKQEIITKDNIIVRGINGEKVVLRITSAPVKNAQGQLTSVVTLLEDITEKRQIENMKNQFLSFAAHQLRTPLGSIRWNLEMLLKGEIGTLPELAVDSLKQIEECNQRMIKRVNELLDVSMIEEGKWEDLAVLTDVMPIIEDAVKEVSIDATVKNINIILKAPTTPLAQIVVGKKRFEQAIITILSNAIKFNQQDGKVTIDFRQDNKKLQIIITDTGIGIPRDDQSKIFSKFFRAKNALLTETEGTGLGLFIIKSYIEKWGGKISLKSQEGKYTTYYLEFQIP